MKKPILLDNTIFVLLDNIVFILFLGLFRLIKLANLNIINFDIKY